MAKFPLFSLALLAGLVIITVGSAGAAPGVLDPSFGDRGTVTTVFGPGNDSAIDVAIQPDGMIVAAGVGDDKIALARYTARGVLDSTFGAGGKVTTAVGRSSGAGAVALQPDGKILVAGSTYDGTDSQFALVRYTSTGALDPSFGTRGIVTTSLGGGSAFAHALVLQPDGKIVAAGSARADFALARYESDGSLDESFGDGGTVRTAVGRDDTEDTARALVLQPDGKLAAAGWTDGGDGGGYDFALARYRPDGSLDPAFGDRGRVTTAIGPNHDMGSALVLQPDGKLVAAGFSEKLSGDGFALARYNPDGSLDKGFGKGAVPGTSVIVPSGWAEAVVLQPDGKILAAGWMWDGSHDYDFGLARYNANGSLDTGFGKRGTVKTAFGPGSAYAYALALQPNGRAVAAGTSTPPGSYIGDFAVARYLGGEARCVVPKVTGTTLERAKPAIMAAGCSVGTVRHTFSDRVRKGRVLSQKPKAGVERALRARVHLVVSKGRSPN